MEWLQLRTESIGSLAMFMLCLVVSLYLLSIRHKSRDGRCITTLFVLFVLNHLAGFFGNALAGTWSSYVLQLQDVSFCISIIYTVFFIYGYQQNPFKKEMRLVLILTCLLDGLALYWQPTIFVWTSLLHLLYYGWILVVLMRKMVIASLADKRNEIVGDEDIPPVSVVSRQIWKEILFKEFKHPTNAISKAYKAFALWNIANIVLFSNIALLVTQINYDYDYWLLVHHALILITIIWLVIIYVNHAVEPTTFLVKIVGLVLCFTLY